MEILKSQMDINNVAESTEEISIINEDRVLNKNNINHKIKTIPNEDFFKKTQ